MMEVFRQFALYGAAGGAAVATHLAVLGVLVEWAGTDKTAASTAGFLCAIPINYLLQHRFVFACEGAHRVFFWRYLLVTLIALGLNAILFRIGIDLLGVHYLVTQVFVIAFVVSFNFLVNWKFTFAALEEPRSSGG
ncbi:MAG: GtrA family protein [Alphaproteobacteria bacterium]|nr:GtrA family protein [Alphaproteobacteria bacterium]